MVGGSTWGRHLQRAGKPDLLLQSRSGRKRLVACECCHSHHTLTDTPTSRGWFLTEALCKVKENWILQLQEKSLHCSEPHSLAGAASIHREESYCVLEGSVSFLAHDHCHVHPNSISHNSWYSISLQHKHCLSGQPSYSSSTWAFLCIHWCLKPGRNTLLRVIIDPTVSLQLPLLPCSDYEQIECFKQ